MKVPRLRFTAAITATLFLLLAASNVFAFTPGSSHTWTQDFDTDDSGWYDNAQFAGYGTITQVPSTGGTLGVTSESGTGHAEIEAVDGGSGPFSRFDGYRSVFPGEWTASIDVYLDPSALPTGAGFDYSVAANGTDGAHQRDFIFHIAKYDSPSARVVIGASNNSNNSSPRADLETLTNHAVITTPGWYTLRHRFYNVGGVLNVDLSVIDSSNTVLMTETRTDGADLIPSVVGGNRYGWFTFIDGGPFAIDNQELNILGGYEVVTKYDLELSTNTPSDAWNSDKWFFYNDENDTIDNALGTFVIGPADPVGQGSAQISVSGTQRRNLATYQFRGIDLADITVLSFSTYNPSVGNGGSANRSAYLQFNVSFDGADTWQRRLTYLPSQNGTVTQDTWQNWDAINNGNALWSWSYFAGNGNKWPDNNTNQYRTWADLVSSFPNIQIRDTDAFLGFRVGEPYANGYTENIDAFTFGTTVAQTTFDFESVPPVYDVITQYDLEPSTNLAVAASNDKWFFYNDENDTIDNALGTFVFGPDDPAGEGSAQISVSGTQRRNLATYQFRGTKLADIHQLEFSTYNPSAGNGGSPNNSAYLQFNVSFDGVDNWQRRLTYLPKQNGTVLQDTWQTWDAINDGNALWSWSHFINNGNKWPDNNTNQYRTWSDLVIAFPNIQIRDTDSFLGFRVGEPYNDGYTENIDTFTFGSNLSVTTFDFELETRTLSIEDDAINMHGQSTFSVPVLLDPGAENTSAVSFTAKWDQSCVTFDGVTDSDNNGIPNAVTGLPSDTDFDVAVTHNGPANEVTLLITPVGAVPLPALANGQLALLEFNASACDTPLGSASPLPVVFTFPTSVSPSVVPSFGNDQGQSVGGATDGGTVTLTFNQAPSDIELDNSSVDENEPASTVVGELCTQDDTPNGTDCSAGPGTFTYSLVAAGAGCTDSTGNFAFKLGGAGNKQLQTKGALNFETQNSYSVCIQSTDAYGLSRIETFAIVVNNVNEAPTDIQLDNTDVDENAAVGTVVGNLSTVDEDSPDSHTYTFCSASPAFSISGSALQTAAGINFEAQSSYNICIRSTDAGTLFVERNFTISVNDLNDAPVAVNDFTATAPLVVVGDGVPVEIDVLTNDTDQDGDPLTINTPIGTAAHGTTSIVANKANYLADTNYNGPDSFTYTAKDPSNAVSNAATVSLAVVADDERADCNADGQIDAADFPATVLEIFDTDAGLGWWLTYTGGFAGSPLGCDSNNSKNGLAGTAESVDAADIICTVLIFFGDNSCTEAASVASAGAVGSMNIPDSVSGTAGETASVPLTLDTGGNDIAAATFSLVFDGATASFDPTDSDGDGVPDALTLNIPANMAKTVIFNAAANRIQVAVYGTTSPMPLLSDGVLATIELELKGGTSALILAQGSLGNDAGQSIPVDGITTPTQGNGALFLPLLGQE